MIKKLSTEDRARLKELNQKIKELQVKLVKANQLEGRDDYVDVKVKNRHAFFQRIKQEGTKSKDTGDFFLEVNVTSKQGDVYVPVSIASGKKQAGFMYQIEGTAPGIIFTAGVKVRGEGVSQVTLGTILYAKIPAGKTAGFEIRVTIRGKRGMRYKIVITRFNYKLNLSETRYRQYLKEMYSKEISFS